MRMYGRCGNRSAGFNRNGQLCPCKGVAGSQIRRQWAEDPPAGMSKCLHNLQQISRYATEDPSARGPGLEIRGQGHGSNQGRGQRPGRGVRGPWVRGKCQGKGRGPRNRGRGQGRGKGQRARGHGQGLRQGPRARGQGKGQKARGQGKGQGLGQGPGTRGQTSTACPAAKLVVCQ